MNATEMARISDAYYSGTTTKREVCDAAALLREENESLRAENAKLREQGVRAMDKIMELGTKNDRLRELAEAAWGCVNRHVSCDECRVVCSGCTLQSNMRELGIKGA